MTRSLKSKIRNYYKYGFAVYIGIFSLLSLYFRFSGSEFEFFKNSTIMWINAVAGLVWALLLYQDRPHKQIRPVPEDPSEAA